MLSTGGSRKKNGAKGTHANGDAGEPDATHQGEAPAAVATPRQAAEAQTYVDPLGRLRVVVPQVLSLLATFEAAVPAGEIDPVPGMTLVERRLSDADVAVYGATLDAIDARPEKFVRYPGGGPPAPVDTAAGRRVLEEYGLLEQVYGAMADTFTRIVQRQVTLADPLRAEMKPLYRDAKTVARSDAAVAEKLRSAIEERGRSAQTRKLNERDARRAEAGTIALDRSKRRAAAQTERVSEQGAKVDALQARAAKPRSPRKPRKPR